jgi:uncharacterized membrane protein YbhN (UPF0104 family)
MTKNSDSKQENSPIGISPKAWIHGLVSCGISGLLLFTIFREQNLSDFLQGFKEIKLPWLYGYIALSVTALLVRAQRYRIVVELSSQETSKQPYTAFVIITAIRNALVDFLPARLGELSFFYIARRYGVPLSAAMTAFGLCFALDIAVLFGIVFSFFASSPLLSLQDSIVDKLGSGLAIASVSLLGFSILFICIFKLSQLLALVVAALRYLAKQSPKKLGQIIAKVADTIKDVEIECSRIKKRRAYPLLILQTLLLRVCKYGSLYLLLLSLLPPAVIYEINPLVATIGFISAEAAASLPVSGLMGFGAYEGTWALVLSLSNVQVPSLTSLIFMVHLITQAIGYSIALLALLVFLLKELRNVSND